MNPHKILIVEDEKDVQRMYQRFFELEKFAVETADDGITGLEKARKVRPDLIALDLMLPGKDGLEVLTELKGDPDTSGIPVVILSNLGEETMVQQCLKLGALAYMVKLDFTPTEVVAQVRYFLTNRPNQQPAV